MPRHVDPATRRAQILAAAVRLFGQRGFARTRMEDIAQAAGVAKGSVYLYFDSREAILAAAFTEYTARSETVLDHAVRGPGAPLNRLADLVRATLDLVASEPDLARVLVDCWIAEPIVDLCLHGLRRSGPA